MVGRTCQRFLKCHIIITEDRQQIGNRASLKTLKASPKWHTYSGNAPWLCQTVLPAGSQVKKCVSLGGTSIFKPPWSPISQTPVDDLPSLWPELGEPTGYKKTVHLKPMTSGIRRIWPMLQEWSWGWVLRLSLGEGLLRVLESIQNTAGFPMPLSHPSSTFRFCRGLGHQSCYTCPYECACKARERSRPLWKTAWCETGLWFFCLLVFCFEIIIQLQSFSFPFPLSLSHILLRFSFKSMASLSLIICIYIYIPTNSILCLFNATQVYVFRANYLALDNQLEWSSWGKITSPNLILQNPQFRDRQI